MDLDFHVEFPSPPDYESSKLISDNNAGNDNEGSLERIWPVPGDKNANGGKEVVIVLLGWAGSQHKHLAKYSDIYLKRGCIVLRYITPVNALFVKTSQLPSLANRLLMLIKELQLDSHPIFFHVFSNGGAFMYSYILGELSRMQGSSLTLDVRGSIFDSCPSARSLGKCFKALTSIMTDLSVLRFLIAGFVIFLIVIQVFWYQMKEALQLCLNGEPVDALDPRKTCLEETPLKNWLERLCKMRNHNCLYLYSDIDDLIPAQQVEQIADITQLSGNNVEKLKFVGSEHVQHYRKYPNEYVNAVSQFIRKAMVSKSGPIVLWQSN